MRAILYLSTICLLVCDVSHAWAQPEPPAEYQRHRENLAVMKNFMAGTQSDDKKFERLAEAMRRDANPDHRLDLLALVGVGTGKAREAFLIGVLQSDADCNIRSAAATMLGRFGSEAATVPLAKAAASDAVTFGQMGCIRFEGAARRSAIFALAELGRRFPKSAAAIIKEIRNLPETDDGDKRLANEHLENVRRWALYQLTEDRSLLATEFEQLKSTDAKTRCNGVVAFRFLNLKIAPPELVALARDPSPDVRPSVAMVLGEIGDRKTIPLLMELVKDAKMDRYTRCDAIGSLGRMRATDAQSLMEGLLSDNDLKMNAAIALSLITGKRHPLVPEGYGGADWPGNSGQRTEKKGRSPIYPPGSGSCVF
jgi:HEAT repeat protein